MKLKIAAVAALGASSLVGLGATPATGVAGSTAHHAVRRTSSVASSGCRRLQSTTPSVTGAGLAAVQFVSATTGWVVGDDRVLATTDGGGHWSRQRTVHGAGYSSVDAIDINHAWVVGRHQLIRTTNGGASWRRLPEPCPVISSVHFVSPSHGFAVAGGKLLATSDAGRRWHAMSAPARVQSVCFTSTQLGWLGAHGKIYRTVNGGAVWALAVAGVRGHGSHGGPTAEVECAGPDAGWAELIGPGVGMNQMAHIGYHLSDSGSQPIFAEQQFAHPGVTIHRESPGSQPAAFSAVDASTAVFIDFCPACGVGTSPLAIATSNGQTLDRVGRVRHLDEVYGASFASATDGWAVGGVDHFSPNGNRITWKIVHTTDGGRHWTTQYVA